MAYLSQPSFAAPALSGSHAGFTSGGFRLQKPLRHIWEAAHWLSEEHVGTDLFLQKYNGP